MKFLQNIARVFVDQLEKRVEHEIKEVFAPVPKRKARKQSPPKPQRQIVQVAPGIEYIPPPKANKK